ncbi:phenylalanine--tRNA ligase subunit alpha, partial [Candidatus Woesearchaeota archaeon]|nr:phenylalanine--tRNA ligase subunit alpha [Candidatus Woesearchaeota archaeon]
LASLSKNGLEYLKKGLPERRFLNALAKKAMSLGEVKKAANLEPQELNACIGVLRAKAAIGIEKGVISLTEQGKKLAEKESLEEKFLKKLSKGPVKLSDLSAEEKFALEILKKRREIININLVKIRKIKLTELGKRVTKIKITKVKLADRLTSDMLKKRTWKNKNFRAYDVKINVPQISFGRKQHYRSFLDYVRQKFSSLGFKEMYGPIVETDFWNMDALFMPQFHSARDIHQAYYIKEPKYGKLDNKIIEKVKQAHENGFGTGSKGWKYAFDVKRTKQLLLRTQGTALSARTLASKELQIPGKYFGITKCFRYDVIDSTHLPDFFQTEGIVVEEGLNFTHLKGLLKLFAEEFAKTDKIKIKPAYFPFTEPSCELMAKHPDIGWIELGGAGIFRPELTRPLGVNVPVIAWGMGIDRIGMFNMGIDDIRHLYSHDIKFLREIKVI